MSLLERRRAPRFPFHTRGVLALAGGESGGTVIDLSAKGALFALGSSVEAAIGQSCRLSLMVGEQPGWLILDGTVASRREQMVGVRFGELDEAARKGLEQIIEMNLGAPHLLDRDMPALLREVSAAAPTADGPA